MTTDVGSPRLRPVRLLAGWLASALALLFAAGVVEGADVKGIGGAIAVAALVAVLNAVLPPLVAALRMPFTAVAGFLLVLGLDAAMLLIAADIAPDYLHVDGFGTALLVALIAAAVSAGVSAVAGIDDDHTYTLRVARRVARRQGKPISTDAP
jgi:putative membrane protein